MRIRPNVSAVAGLLAAILMAGSLPLYAQTSPVVARAASVTGRVLLASAGNTTPVALTTGFVLTPGDQVDTRGGGRVVIDLSDGSVIVVQPETVLTLKDYRAAESLRELFQITIGIVRVKINHFVGRPNPYRMNSPTASIAVRGTEFSVAVGGEGETRVEVFEGAVEVASRQDPDRKALVEGGSAVLVRAGQDLLRYTPVGGPDKAPRGGWDRDNRNAPASMPRPDDKSGPVTQQPPPRDGSSHTDPGTNPTSAPHRPAQFKPDTGDGEQHPVAIDDFSPRSTASTYERYISGLTELGQVPFVNRYTAFPEVFLDAFENPAYATEFRHAEGRLFLLPTWSGARQLDENSAAFGSGGNRPADSSISPQFSVFTPVAGGRFVAGANATASHIDSSATSSSADGTFSSFAGTFAARFGDSSAGFSMERLRGSGSLSSGFSDSTALLQYETASSISQTRFTFGLARDLSPRHKLGAFYRYGLIDASDVDQRRLFLGQPVSPNATRSTGHSSEIGVRLRGVATRKLFYGVSATWLGLSLRDTLDRTLLEPSTQRDRLKRGVIAGGIGYLLDRHTVLTADVSGGLAHSHAARWRSSTGLLAEDGCSTNRSISSHVAVQRDLSRRFFATGSYLHVWRSSALNVIGFPDSNGLVMLVNSTFFPLTESLAGRHFSDFGAGWRIRPNLTAQYVFSTDYGATSASHAVLLRYTFRLRGE